MHLRMCSIHVPRGGVQLRADARRRVRIGEQHRPERDVTRAGGDELERVAPGRTPPIPTIGMPVAR